VSDTRLTCCGYMPLKVSPPMFCVGGVELDPHFTARARDAAYITGYVFTAMTDDQEGQELLDTYLSKTGVDSIRAALNAAGGKGSATALSGAADTMTIKKIEGYRTYPVGETMLFGAQIILHVIGPTS
jgi:hypothetical protein